MNLDERYRQFSDKPCPECGEREWMTDIDAPYYLPGITGKKIIGGKGTTAISMICQNCGYIKLYMAKDDFDHMKSTLVYEEP